MATFLLLHGACYGGWCWESVATELEHAGHVAIAPDLPCDDVDAGLEEYAATAERALGSYDDLVVVGHSLGALTAPVVASRNDVRRLTFVAGIIGAPRKSLADLEPIDADRDVPLQQGVDYEMDDSGRFRFTEEGAARALHHDCPPEVAADACRRLRFQCSMWTKIAPFDDWPDVEVHSILCREDRIVYPEWTRRVSRDRLGVDPIEIDGGHAPMLSRPEALTEVLLKGL